MSELSPTRIEKRIKLIDSLLRDFQEESEISSGEPPFQYTDLQHGAYTLEERDFEILQQFETLGLLTIVNSQFIPIDPTASTLVPSGEIAVAFVLHSKEALKKYSRELQEMIKPSKPLIRLQTLQHIAKKIAENNSGTELIFFLKSCGVREGQIEYPQTKWRMVFSIFEQLAISSEKSDTKLLLTILEEACHPTMHSGDLDTANLFTDTLNQWLKYDDFYVDEKHTLWQTIDDYSIDKDGDVRESECGLCLPKTLENISTFLLELIDIVKFYINHRLIIDNTRPLNEVYVDLMEKFNEQLCSKGSGNLSSTRPQLLPLLDDYYDFNFIEDFYRNLYKFLEEILALHQLRSDARLRVETENKELFANIRDIKREYLLSFSKTPVMTMSSSIARDLRLLWTGSEILDAEKPENRIICREKESFPKKVLSLCFQDYRSPRRVLTRIDLGMQPRDIKQDLKNLVTNWSKKFNVSRSTIGKIIYFREEDSSVYIAESLEFGGL